MGVQDDHRPKQPGGEPLGGSQRVKARGRPKDYPWTVQPGARMSDSGPHIEEVVDHNTHKPDSRSGKKVYEGDMVGIRVTTHYESMEAQSLSPGTPHGLSVKQKRK